MTEIKQLPELCECGRKLETRMNKFKIEKETGWTIHGFCEWCRKVYMIMLFVQEEKPVQDRDFMFIEEKVKVEGGK